MAPNQLQIKTNVLGRLLKEEKLYRKEAQDLRTKVQQLEKANADIYSIKKVKEVLDETDRMIPEMRIRIASALENLKKLVGDRNDEETKPAYEYIKTAESLLA